jgi:Zn-dependent protease with chaperone function
VGIVFVAIFSTPRIVAERDGVVLGCNNAPELWERLADICEKVGGAVPDQVIAGVDDNFFVTEQPLLVNGKRVRGKSLYVSLALLKHLNEREADAVLAHEMAHFSGGDTLFARKISPLLARYENYMAHMQGGLVTLPMYFLLLCFRACYELPRSQISRDREFRADAIAANATTPDDFAAGLLRITAYSHFRGTIETNLFRHNRELESVDIGGSIDRGFAEYALSFAQQADLGSQSAAHPFDSHPPLVQRWEALGIPWSPDKAQRILAEPVDGAWRTRIPAGEELERQQWQAVEQAFQQNHLTSLAYRFLPASPEEKELVSRTFPPVVFEGAGKQLVLDCEQLDLQGWSAPIRYPEITSIVLQDGERLEIHYRRLGSSSRIIELKMFGKRAGEILPAVNRYYGRYLAAVEYQKRQVKETGIS